MRTPLPIFAGLLIACLASQAHAYDLLDAWRAAKHHDTGIAASTADYQAGQEAREQGRALLLPQVNLSASYAHNNNHISTLDTGLPYTAPQSMSSSGLSRTYGINLTQPLFDLAKWASYRQGELKSTLATATYQSAEQQLIVDVASAYFKVLQAQDTLSATEIAKQAYAKQLDQAKTEFDIGSATITDTNEAQANYDTALADEINAQSDLEIARNDLARLTGLSPLALQPLLANLPLSNPVPDSLAGWIQLALSHSQAIRMKQLSLALAQQTLTEKRAGHLPTVQLTASYQNTKTQDQQINNNTSTQSSVGISLSMPLFAGGGINSQVREAAAQLDSARDQLETSQRQTIEDIRRSWLGVTSGAASVRAQQQRLISAQSKLDSTKLGRSVGVRTNLDLLSAQQAYVNVLKDLANARYRYLNAKLQLAQAAGTLDEAVLAQVNQTIQH